MPFVKLDCGILNSSIWIDRPAREVFLTALLMAEPCVIDEPTDQIEIRSLELTGFVVPPGCYGFVKAASSGIIRQAGIEDVNEGRDALERLGSSEDESRSSEWDGRRLVRVNGGFVVLNFDRYRKRDLTGAERARRYREKQKAETVTRDVTAVTRDVTVTSQKQKQKQKQSKQICGIPNEHSKEIQATVECYLALHPRRTVVDEIGRRKIKARLTDGFTVEDLINALRGQAADAWCIEHNKLGLAYALRDADNVSDFIGRHESKGNKRAVDELPLLGAE